MSDEIDFSNGFEVVRDFNKTWRATGSDVQKIIKETQETEAVKQAIWHILNTERYSNPIYSDDYGVELEQYIGKDEYYLESSIQETLQDALLQDDRIISVTVMDINKTDKQSCLVTFAVDTVYGKITEELNVSI